MSTGGAVQRSIVIPLLKRGAHSGAQARLAQSHGLLAWVAANRLSYRKGRS